MAYIKQFNCVLSDTSVIEEQNFWITAKNGSRSICITYKYCVGTGELHYAATVFRKPSPSYVMTAEDVANSEHTTAARFSKRPVILAGPTAVKTNMDYDAIIDEIRHQMCRGPGCKGPRLDRCSISEDEDPDWEMSSTSSYDDDDEDYQVSQKTHRLKTVRRLRYISHERDIFIAFKGSKSDGDVLFGAAIKQKSDPDESMTPEEVEAHFQTAYSRLEKCPVHTNIPRGFRHQLKPRNHNKHCEDVMYCLLDTIFKRKGGELQIRGIRYDEDCCRL